MCETVVAGTREAVQEELLELLVHDPSPSNYIE